MNRSATSTSSMKRETSSVKAPESSRDVYSLSLTGIKQHAEYADYHFKPAPFCLRWIYGFNPKVGVINLNNLGSTMLFYAASNCGVVWNWTLNTMHILQGHRHMVTCIAADQEGRWLVTGDSGPENVVIIWDSKDYFPHKTIFNPHQNTKLCRLALSADAKYLLTVGYKEKATLNWWIWSFGLDQPHASVDVDIPRDSILAMEFNPQNSTQFVLLTKSDIWIGFSSKIMINERGQWKESDDYQIRVRCPSKKMSPDCGRMTCFTFVKGSFQIIVGTSKGGVVVYGYTIEYRTDVDPLITSNVDNLRFVKMFKIEKFRINVIKSIDGVIVTGNSGGEIHFYDEQMKLMYWVHGFTVDCVKALSFNIAPRTYIVLDPLCNKKCPCWEQVVVEKDSETGLTKQKFVKHLIPDDATVEQKSFLVRDFIVVTRRQGIAFVDFVTEHLVTILDYRTSPALSLTVHPENPLVCVGYADGTVELVNFENHKVCHRVDLRDVFKIVTPPDEDSFSIEPVITYPQLSVMCLKYSPSGTYLACGLNTGQLVFLDPTTIDPLHKKPYHDTTHAIKEIVFSPDSLTVAFSDVGRTVCVYKFDCKISRWHFIGKHRSHYKEISAVLFLPQKNPDGEYKLLSLGHDLIMAEYDIGKSSDEHLGILSMDRMEQAAIPLCAIVWATPNDVKNNPEELHTDLPLMLVANDEFKYKILNYTTTMTLATYLGPRYEDPVNSMLLTSKTHEDVDGQKEEREYLVFATKNVIGLHRLPLDGNPWKHTGMLGHPNQILNISYRHDAHTLFTIGSKDTCVCQWSADYSAPDQSTTLGGGDLDPYYCLVENGRPGWLFQEVRDLFYYIQILCQGTFSPAIRRVNDYIPIDSLPDLVRALGFFPSEYEVRPGILLPAGLVLPGDPMPGTFSPAMRRVNDYYIPIDSLPDLVRALGFFPSEYEVENLLTEAKFKIYQRSPAEEIDFEEFMRLYLNHRPAFGENYIKLRKAFKNFAYFDVTEHVLERDEFIQILGTYGERFSKELSLYLLSVLCGLSSEERSNSLHDDFSFLPERIRLEDLTSTILGIQEMDGWQSYAGSLHSEAASSAGSDDQLDQD